MKHFDVVHAVDWPFFIPLALSRRRSEARAIMTLHGTEINETQTFLKRLAIRMCDVFGDGTEIVANSEFTRNLFKRYFDVGAERVNAVPLGVSDYWFDKPNPRDVVRERHGISNDTILIITVARLTRRKGHLLTADALASLPEPMRRRITWLIVGPDGESDYIRELSNRMTSAGCDIRRLGVLANDSIRDLYGASDIFCMTGLNSSSGRVEGFGLVYLEAAAARLPSIATRVGGVAEAVLADQTGLLTQEQPAAVAEAISKLIQQPELRARLASAALAHARHHSWTRCAARTYALPMRDPA